MRTSRISVQKSKFTCGKCSLKYVDYKKMLEHLYWRHGTESVVCKKCQVKRWPYAAHKCDVLPIYVDFNEDSGSAAKLQGSPDHSEQKTSPNHTPRETEYCYCGKHIDDAPMIGCDGPSCYFQWYHFPCVGITSAPVGDWLCPTCENSRNNKQVKKGTET